MSILTKLKDFVGINEEPDDYYYDEEIPEDEYETSEIEEPEVQEIAPAPRAEYEPKHPPVRTTNIMESNKTRSNVIGMPGVNNGIQEVVVIEPHSFEEMPRVIETLRERRSVVLNLNVMNPEEAQRAVDFVAGGTYAIDGHQERIGESIFLFTPNCVKVSTLTGLMDELEDATSKQQLETKTKSNISPTPTWAADRTRLAQ